MSPGSFEERRAAEWVELDRLLTGAEKGKPEPGVETLPKRFREACADLALARHRMYPSQLIDRLNSLVIRGYKQLYRTRQRGWEAVVRFFLAGFPQAVRAEWRMFWLCSALFWIPFFGMMASAYLDIDWIRATLGPDGMSRMESMYGGDQQLSHLRSEFGSDFRMFAFYIKNNVGIDFQIFAGGIVACLGTIFFLVFNGIQIGASAGYANYACNPEAFWSFVAGHSSYELLGMVVAGMAGMRLGMGVLKPGRLPRGRAMGEAAKQALPLIYGAGAMTALAAVFEGFWSAEPIPVGIKYGVGIAGWVLCFAYFLLMGRGTRAA
ncbi:stage II sporulation protein M [Haloferula sp. BvORR071]|uniref:stage II sporulation protein M n=1 Tax=Haloferula sp. BvORR071 TaxID=1396141 RepID=UPI000550D970|nr:stage II sporulation protein M [Haloferula sp. BvORR071]